MTTENGRRAGHRAGTGKSPGAAWPDESRHRWSEILSSAGVILAGVLLVIGFGFVASRAMRHDDTVAKLPDPAPPALGDITLPPDDQGLIPLGSPSPSPSLSPSPSAKPSSAPPSKSVPPPDQGAITVVRSNVPSVVDLSAEGRRDWVHWGEGGTFALERNAKGGFAILEGAPTAPRFRHELSPQRFSWSGGDPIARSGGTQSGIRTCDAGNGFTISAPAATGTRTLKLYVGVISGTGRLEAKLTTGKAAASATLSEPTGAIRTAVLTVTYRAPKAGQLRLSWTTRSAVGKGCGGVALEAATLR